MKIVMLGATGAVGGQVVENLLRNSNLGVLTLLGRRIINDLPETIVRQHVVDVFNSAAYLDFLSNHDVAICTLGVGQPSKVSKDDFLKIDKLAVLDFANACKNSGIKHFELLASVGIDANSRSFYLRSKGELVQEIKKLNFNRFSVFEPSMILTPKNRYGKSQGIVLAIWPLLKPLLFGSLRKYRGVPVQVLGEAMVTNVFLKKKGDEHLQWDDFYNLVKIK